MRSSFCYTGKMKWLLRLALAAFFVRAGQLHFLHTEQWEVIVPPPLPARACVLVSGLAEIVGGVALLLWPRGGVWWLIALLIAVFPANVYQAMSGVKLYGFPDQPWKGWARLPMQIVLIGLVWLAR
ncbi:DoxX family membrane protein [bacterium]|nr:DoxX family membrane protein [bacterium]